MRVRREKGFKKIEIVDPYSENLKNKCIDLSNTKYRKFIIIFFPTIFTILLFYGIQKLMPETDSDYSKTNFDISKELSPYALHPVTFGFLDPLYLQVISILSKWPLTIDLT